MSKGERDNFAWQVRRDPMDGIDAVIVQSHEGIGIGFGAGTIFSSVARGKFAAAAGFTLLEVMIAIGVIAIAMMALLSLHDSNLQSVMRGQELSTASTLAQGLMSAAEMERVPIIASTQGDFEKLYPGAYRNFRWERDVEMSGMFPDVRKVQVIVYYGPRFRHNFTLVEFLHDPTPQIMPGQQGAPGGTQTPKPLGARTQ